MTEKVYPENWNELSDEEKVEWIEDNMGGNGR